MALQLSDAQYNAIVRCVKDAKSWHQQQDEFHSGNHHRRAEHKELITQAEHGLDVLKMQHIRALKEQRAKVG